MLTCIDPNALKEGQLQSYAVDPTVSDPAVEQHLQNCPACQAEVNAMRAVSVQISDRLYRYDCLTTEVIIGLAAGILPHAERAAAEAHVRNCARCAEEVALTAAALAQPEPLLQWTAPSLAAQVAAQVRRLVATLASALAPDTPELALGVRLRGSSDAATKPQVYRAESVTVVLRATPDPDTAGQHLVEGLITDASAPNLAMQEIPVRLFVAEAADPVAEETALGGAFVLGSVPPGEYALEVTLPNAIVTIPTLAV
jgi:anti-sigma factor ChrR (cupin superfamily)